MPAFARRTLLQGSLAAAVTAAATLGTARPAAAASGMRASSSRPRRTPSYGPNATHFPDATPWPGTAAATELVAECSWADIAAKVAGVTPQQVEAGVIVRVKPGTLPGNGSGSSSRAVLTGVGNPAWRRNVLIVPRDGFGTVTVTGGIRIDQSTRLSLFGFVSPAAFVLTRCADIEMGWSRWSAGNITQGAERIAFYELVLGFRQDPEDTAGVRPTSTYPMSDISRHGCVYGPSVKPTGSSAHCDTIQLEGTGTGPFGVFTSVDCIDYGSSNAVIMIHAALQRAEFRHCAILGGDLPWAVYPLRPGDYAGTPNAFSGSGSDVRLYDSFVVGAVGRTRFTVVERTSLSYRPSASQQPTQSGAWTVDPSLASVTRDQIFQFQAIDDYELPTLAALWRW
ncbi:hypothetical protein [Microbacterium caowuchunii]|uniref:Uncharacterized protein n=1 Tax=Microbacterium caowuchunii TaxID=2614638 RepID=A0A5N0TEM8_9MICO|nr:hypothetical protein [Microbacterium caowuchunii]KAA9132904.1 hypothetical protein F6B40_09985 [Microbacterium caowuchunii]